MKLSLKWLSTYFDAELPTVEELNRLFTFHFSEVEEIDKKGDDVIFDLKILPDRAHYALSHKGVAHEVAALTGIPIKPRFMPEVEATISAQPTITIAHTKFCRRMTARILENVVVEPSPEWLVTALEAVGARSINTIVDLTNYVMYDIGQPLHAFDADKIQGNVTIRSAKEGEKLVLLNDKEIVLTEFDTVIADEVGPLDLAGVKGGKRAEVSVSTKRILMTSGNFHPSMVRKSAFRHDLRNEASKRFENEITPELAIHGMNNVSALVREIVVGSQFGQVIDLYPTKPEQTVIDFNPAYLKTRLGIDISEIEVKNILSHLEIQNDNWKLTIPFHRLDLTIPEDIVEEVGRIYGYDSIAGILPPSSSGPVSVLPEYYATENIKNILVKEGFSEVYLYTFVPRGDIEIAKPLASDKRFARTMLAEGIQKCLEKNALNADLLGLLVVKVFEIGKVFTSSGEFLHLSIGVAHVKKVKGKNAESVLNEILQKLEKELGVSLRAEVKSQGMYATAEIDLATIISSEKTPDSYSSLNLTKAVATSYRPFSVYPFIVRDIALFVKDDITEEDVWKEIEQGIREEHALDWLVRHELFDVFQKDGKTSYAFRMVFQSMNETLTDDDVANVMEKIYFQVKDKGWEVR